MTDTKKKKSRLVGLGVAAVAVASVFLIDWSKEPEAEPPGIRPLKTIVVQGRATEDVYTYLGVIEAAEEVAGSFNVAGSLIELNVNKGDKVVKGQVLARLDPRDFENSLAVAKADAEEARIVVERLRPAAVSGAITKQEMTAAEREFSTTAATVKIREKALADSVVMASFDGVISDVIVENFENVQAKQHVLTLQATDQVNITVDVPESRISRIDPARRDRAATSRFEVSLDYFPEQSFVVTLFEFKTEADALTMTYKATFTMPRPETITLLPGMPATMTEHAPVRTQQQGGVLLPLDAVPVGTDGVYFVWKLKEYFDGVYSVHQTPVEVGELQGDSIVVMKGVAALDRIAAAGVHVLTEGQEVRLLEVTGDEQ
jgi:RND family efflux transporter MFP subunit